MKMRIVELEQFDGKKFYQLQDVGEFSWRVLFECDFLEDAMNEAKRLKENFVKKNGRKIKKRTVIVENL